MPERLADAGVTAREAEVFWLVADRLRNREIADRLVVSVRTVDSHVASLLRKLGCPDRLALVAEGRRLRGAGTAGTARPRLPLPLDAYVPRSGELAALRAQVSERRLVTLVGPPGVGKSRLALELAQRTPALPPPLLVDLTAVADDSGPAHAMLEALGVGAPDQAPLPALRDSLAAAPAWLVLDNCEHVADGVAALLRDLLAAVGDLHVLATSQRPLGVPGEVVVAVDPLPPAGAAALFADRASAASAGFDAATDREAIAALCRRLDGLPLAIELAAARMRSFTPAELAAQLEDRFTLLGPLETAIAWSVQLLDGTEARLLQRLSVFAGSFAFEDAVAVAAAAGPGLTRQDVTRALPGLVDRSLVNRGLVHPGGTRARRPLQAGPGAPGGTPPIHGVAEPVTELDARGGTVFRLLDSIRAFAAGRLEEEGEAEAARRAHARHHLGTAGEAGYEGTGWVRARWAELRRATRWALDAHEDGAAWRFLAGVGLGWEDLGVIGEVFEWLEVLLSRGLPSDPILAADATLTAAHLLSFRDASRSLALAERALALAPRWDPARVGRAHAVLGWSLAYSGRPQDAEAAFSAALAVLPAGAAWERAFAHQGRGRAAAGMDVALAHFAEAAALFAAVGDDVKLANVRYMMADRCERAGQRLGEARAWLEEAARLAAAADSRHESLHAAIGLARLDLTEGHLDAARDALTDLLPAFRRLGDRRCVTRCLLWLGELDLAQGREGDALPRLEEAVALAAEVGAGGLLDAARERRDQALRTT